MSIFKFFTRRQSETLADNFASLDVGYTEYIARITQSGNAAPFATVLNSESLNFLSGVTFSREDVSSGGAAGDTPGVYRINFSAAIDTSKIIFDANETALDWGLKAQITIVNSTRLILRVFDENVTEGDDLLSATKFLLLTLRLNN